MDQVKIGKLIAECRKNKELTQVELAQMLGVTDKSVSKWENGKGLPDVSLYKPLCEILDITLNEFFAGEKIKDENYKRQADENLYKALKSSVFTLKERIEYFKNKWQKEHFFELTLTMLVIVGFIIYGFVKDTGIQYLFIILGFISGIYENNRMMSYVESNAYGKKEDDTLREFEDALIRLYKLKDLLENFKSRKEAIDYLIKETKLSKKECETAYDFVISLNLDRTIH